MDEFEIPDEKFVQDFQNQVTDTGCLTERGISLSMIQEALRSFNSWPNVTVNGVVNQRSMRELAQGLLKLSRSSLETNTNRMDATLSEMQTKISASQTIADTAQVQARTIMIVDLWNSEGVAGALVLQKLLLVLAASIVSCIPQLLAIGERVPSTTERALLFCTEGILHQQRWLEDVFALAEIGAEYVVVVSSSKFRFPTSVFLEDIQPLTTFIACDSDAFACMVKDIFKSIAFTFDAESYTEYELVSAATRIAKRLSCDGNAKLRLPLIESAFSL